MTQKFADLVEEVETDRKLLMPASIIAGLATIGTWLVAIFLPGVFKVMSSTRLSLFVLLMILFAFPFVTVFSVYHMLWPQVKDDQERNTGPFTGYFYQENQTRRRKVILIAAGIGVSNALITVLLASESARQ